MVDSLTNTHSRYVRERRLDEEFQRWQRHAQPLAFSIWDMTLEAAVSVAEKLRKAVETTAFHHHGLRAPVTISFHYRN